MQEKSKRLFGEMLVADNIISQAQLDEAVALQEKTRAAGNEEVPRIGVILGRLGYLSKEQLELYIEKVMQEYA